MANNECVHTQEESENVVKTEATMVVVQEDTYNYGIDALKILSMFMVLVLHICGYGGLRQALPYNSLNYYVSWIMDIGTRCAVNVFALITGYLMVKHKWKLGRIIELWLQVAFYSVGITLLFAIIEPNLFSWKGLVQSFFPVSFKNWWYFSSYFAIFFLIPFLNKLINILSKRQTFILCAVLVSLFSIIETIVPIDVFSVSEGYSPLWLAVLYIIGATIRKYDCFKKGKCFFIVMYVMCVILALVGRITVEFLTKRIFGKALFLEIFTAYTSPLILIMAISLLQFFKQLRFPKKAQAILRFLSPLSFAVYIIHMHNILFQKFFVGKFAYLANQNVFVLIGTVLGFAIAVFAVCIIIEYIRIQLFKWTRINKGIKQLGCFLDNKIGFDK